MKPLFNRLTVRLEPASETTASGLLVLPGDAKEARFPKRTGIVVDVGCGMLNNHGNIDPVSVEPGDRIVFGVFKPTMVRIGDEYLALIKESMVFGVVGKEVHVG